MRFDNTYWSLMREHHEFKRAKIDLLCSQYESFKMQENKSIDDMITKFTKITNALASLGDEISNDQRCVR